MLWGYGFYAPPQRRGRLVFIVYKNDPISDRAIGERFVFAETKHWRWPPKTSKVAQVAVLGWGIFGVFFPFFLILQNPQEGWI